MEQSILYVKKILLVDDEPKMQELVTDILTSDGFQNIILADSCQTALLVAKREKPDFAILDIMLPDGDGFSLMKQLRDFTDIPIIFLTAKEDSQIIELADCTIDFSRAEIYKKNGETYSLTAKEHVLLEILARSSGKIVSIDTCCEALWGDNPFGYENSLNAHIRRIREKIESNPSKPVSLITVKGLGYKLNARK